MIMEERFGGRDGGQEKIVREAQANNEALLQRAHFISKFVTAISNFSVQYNFQSISIALLVMSASVCTNTDSECKEGHQEGWVTSTASAVVFVGAIIGQLTMGYLGDILGRNAAMLLTLSLVVVSALLSAVASVGEPTTIYTVIIIARFFLGMGVGGVYPLSATKAAEDGNKTGKKGGVDVVSASLAFFWQTPGAMGPWLLAYFMSQDESISATLKWRLLLGLGAVPAAIVVLLTLWEMEIKKLIKQNDHDLLTNPTHNVSAQEQEHSRKRQRRLQAKHFRDVKVWLGLMVTGGSWFLYDIAYYGVNLFGGEIIAEIQASDDDNVSSSEALRAICQKQLIGLSLGIPAAIAGILMLKYVSSRFLQIVGFLFITFCFVLMAATFVPLRDSDPSALFFVYCLLLFSLNFGPNITTFVLPAQTFPSPVRATMNGVSAALGKVGAFVGVYMFGAMADATSYPAVMAVCAVFSAFGAILSLQAVHKPPKKADDADEDGEDEDDTLLSDDADDSRLNPLLG